VNLWFPDGDSRRASGAGAPRGQSPTDCVARIPDGACGCASLQHLRRSAGAYAEQPGHRRAAGGGLRRARRAHAGRAAIVTRDAMAEFMPGFRHPLPARRRWSSGASSTALVFLADGRGRVRRYQGPGGPVCLPRSSRCLTCVDLPRRRAGDDPHHADLVEATCSRARVRLYRPLNTLNVLPVGT